MDDKDLAAAKVVERLFELDQFSSWLGISIIDTKDGYSKIQMVLRREMMNGFGIAHGGITFALADSAFAFACISFPRAGKEGDILTAEAKQVSKTTRTGLYLIEVRNQHNEMVALFKGTCYKTEKLIG